jgi:hypothetical protein
MSIEVLLGCLSFLRVALEGNGAILLEHKGDAIMSTDAEMLPHGPGQGHLTLARNGRKDFLLVLLVGKVLIHR